ncbi:hypothetical protein VTO42DRAFT_3986 [Malbranchea cinnamomea]
MPPKPRPVPLKGPLQIADSFFFCPSCSRLYLPTRTSRRKISLQRASNPPPTTPTFASSSAINATKNIPPRFTELYSALKSVGDSAANHVNVSRLQLALRGLETENPVIRVAVLGLGDAATAARLVRLLLADPLGPKEKWEDYLENYGCDNEHGLLIKYGEGTNIVTSASLVPTISIPSTVLRKANLQIYISSLGTGSIERFGQFTPSTLYVPTISIPTTSTGIHSPIRYPVHRTIVCGKGIDDLLTYDRLAGTGGAATEESARAVFDLRLSQIPQDPQTGGGVITFVDVERAESALRVFRDSVQNASEYEREWTGSGVQPLIDWLAKDYSREPIHPDVKHLVRSLLDSAEESVLNDEKQKKLERQTRKIPEHVRHSLDQTVSTWSERAHTELRDTLNEGFMSRQWRDLAWWKLFWRVDDVSMIMTGILEKKWLPQAEKEAIWLNGKIQQAGLLDGDSASEFNGGKPPNEPATASDDVYTTQVKRSRDRLIDTRVPVLHSLAQGLVAFSFSTATLTSALAALTYVSTSTTSAYEAGTVAAVGLVYSLRRQQKRWEAVRNDWESEVREEGRKALRETEDTLRVVVRDGGRHPEPVAQVEARAEIERAKSALSNVN